MVDYITNKNIAVLRINNPPSNALSFNVIKGFIDGIKRANSDGKVQAILITGEGKMFCAGADIRGFESAPNFDAEGNRLSDLGRSLEASLKPVVSAIHGYCLGGGLEVALFGHYRIANKNTMFGFPEVSIGLLPGAQGTVRLPRLAGVQVSMDMIASGRQIDANQALAYGIVDQVCEGDVLVAAKNFVNQVIGKPLDSRRLSKTIIKDTANVDQLYEAALSVAKKKYKGLHAPISCLQAVRNAAKLSFEEAVEEEARMMGELISGAQSAGLRYSFFAQRAAQKWSMPCGASVSNTKPLQVHTTGVIGAGTMGSGIAVCLIRAGYPVVMVERDQKMLEKGLKTVSVILEGSVRLQKMTPAQKDNAMARLKGATSLTQLKDVDLVIEAVFEDLKLKKGIFKELDQICKPSALLCSNTSTLDIDKIASATSRPDKVAGTHFFAPAYSMRLLENVYGTHTSPATVATIMDLGRNIGKICVLVKTCFGFVANRMHMPFSTEANFVVEEGALPAEVDQALEDFGMPMGKFKVSDLSGIDVGWRIAQEAAKASGVELELDTRYIKGERTSTFGGHLYKMGRYGVKTGKGFYRYSSSNPRMAIPDEEVTKLILDHSKIMGIERRPIGSQEITERCLFTAINEGFRILEERIAEKPEDIDIIWQYGFAFPRYYGGPMFYASKMGLARVFEKICMFHNKFPYSSHWVPSDLLRKLASQPVEVPMAQWRHHVGGGSRL